MNCKFMRKKVVQIVDAGGEKIVRDILIWKGTEVQREMLSFWLASNKHWLICF